MILFALLALVAAVGFLAVSSARARGAPQRPVSAAAVRVGAGIACVRLMIFFSGVTLLGYADGRQVFGYALLILNSAVELGIASALYRGPTYPPFVAAVLIALTSILLGYTWAWLRFRPR